MNRNVYEILTCFRSEPLEPRQCPGNMVYIRVELNTNESAMEDEMAKRRKGLPVPSLIALQTLLFLFLMLHGCITTQKSPKREESFEKVPFSEIFRSPERYRGKVVRLGGVILAVLNEEKGSTIEILEQPLNWRGRPKVGDVAGGRFLVVSEGFLDKEIYQPKREATVVGEIIGMKTGQVGETTYNYPLISLRDIRLWKPSGYPGGPRMHMGIGVGGHGGDVGGGVSIGTSF